MYKLLVELFGTKQGASGTRMAADVMKQVAGIDWGARGMLSDEEDMYFFLAMMNQASRRNDMQLVSPGNNAAKRE